MKKTKTKPCFQKINVDLELLAEAMLGTPRREPGTCFLDTRLGNAEFLEPDRDPEFDEYIQYMAEQIRTDEEGRFVPFPGISELTEFGWMESFTELVENCELRNELKQLFDVPKKMERFNELVRRHPEEFRRWVEHRDLHKCAEAESVLAAYGIVEGEWFRFDRRGGLERGV